MTAHDIIYNVLLRAQRDAAHPACEMAFKALAEARGETDTTGLEYRGG